MHLQNPKQVNNSNHTSQFFVSGITGLSVALASLGLFTNAQMPLNQVIIIEPLSFPEYSHIEVQADVVEILANRFILTTSKVELDTPKVFSYAYYVNLNHTWGVMFAPEKDKPP